MASVSFDASKVTHTLPAYFAGVGGSSFNYQALSNASYRAAIKNVSPEFFRNNLWRSVGSSVSNPDPAETALLNLLLFLGSSYGSTWVTGAHPQGTPSSRASNDTGNLDADGTGHSPNDLANWYENVVQQGVTVIGFEPTNEPTNCVFHGGDGPWYGPWPNGTPSDLDERKCIAWSDVHHRLYTNAVKAKAQAHGWPVPKFWGTGGASPQPYYITFCQNFCNGVCSDGSSWPWPDGNWSYFDNVSVHSYATGSTTQGNFNCIFYDPASYTGGNDSIGLKNFARVMRQFFDAQGHTDKTVTSGESAINAGSTTSNEDATAGLWDVAHFICGAAYQALYKIDALALWSWEAHSNSEGPGTLRLVDTDSWTIRTRWCVVRDLVYYFSRNYKRQLISGQAAVTGSGSTPSSGERYGNNNSVPRIVTVAGLNSDGSKLGILVSNIDLSNSESVTITWSGAAATGDATYRQVLTSTSVTGTTSIPTGTQTVSGGTSITRTLEAGSAYLFEVPLSAPAGASPANTAAPAVSGIATQGQTLTVTDGAWTGSPTSYAYQWRRAGAAIGGATSSTYVLAGADVGSTVDCVVTATNANGSTSAASNTVGPVSASSTGFPSTSVLDSFNRANGDVGSAWVLIQGDSVRPVVATNQLTEGSS